MNKKLKTVLVLIIALIGISTTVGAATIFNSRDITYSSDKTTKTNVKDVLDELYTNLGKCPKGQYCYTEALGLSDKVELGDYISMTPTSTSYTISKDLTGYSIDTLINPSELNLWRVIKLNNDGTIEVISEHTSTRALEIAGLKGYKGSVGFANELARQYGNSKYVLKARHFGYSNEIEFCKDFSTCLIGNHNTKDTDLVLKAIGTLAATMVNSNPTSYINAQRIRGTSLDCGSGYTLGLIWTSGEPVVACPLLDGQGIETKIGYGARLRPILTLKSDIKIKSGDGKSAETAYKFE